MASESLYEGIISIVVQDNDAPGQVAAILQRLEQEMGKVSSLPGVNLGEKILGSLDQGVTSAEAGIAKVSQMVQALAAESERLNQINSAGTGSSDTNRMAQQIRETTVAAKALIDVMERLSQVEGRALRSDGRTAVPLTEPQRYSRMSDEDKRRHDLGMQVDGVREPIGPLQPSAPYFYEHRTPSEVAAARRAEAEEQARAAARANPAASAATPPPPPPPRPPAPPAAAEPPEETPAEQIERMRAAAARKGAATETGKLDPNPDATETARREAIKRTAEERARAAAAEAAAVDAEMEIERAASGERVRLRREEAARLAREDPSKVVGYGQLTPSERKSLSPRADGEGANPNAEELVGGLLEQIDNKVSLAGPRDNRNLYAAADINVQGAQAAMQALQRKLEEEAGSLDPDELEGLSRSLMAAYRRLLSATEARAGVLERQAVEAVRFSVDTSGIDGRDSARLQKLQLDEATARATHERLASAEPGQFSEAEVTAARVRLQAATEGVATQREREWIAAEKAADAEELSARTVQPKFAGKIDPNASARVQQLQVSKVLADAQFQTQQALTSPRLTSNTDRAQAFVKANTAAEQLAKQIDREKEAAQKAADEAEIRAKTVEPNFSGVDESAKAKIQQLQVNRAIADAQLKTLQALSPGLRTETEIQQARLKVLRAEEELAKAGVAQADAAAGGAGRRPPGNFWTGLTQGYRGGGGGATGGLGGGFGQGLGEEAGFALKYYAFYQIFAAATAIMSGIANATKEYTLSVNELSIALGTNYAEAGKVAEGYSEIGRTLGAAPTVAVDAGSKFARAFRNEDGSANRDAGMVGARVGSVANLLEASPEAAQKVQESLIAVSKAYDDSASGAANLYDRATQIGQYFGVDSGGELLSGTAQLADLGRASGYSEDQLLALVASGMQGTGLTSDAVAGDLKRVFGADQSSFNAVAANYGIDPTETFAKKMDALSKVAERLPKDEADRISATLGGSRSGGTFASALKGVPEANRAVEESRGYLTADDRATQQLSMLGGKMKQLAGDVQQLFVALATSGIGDVFGVVVEGLHETLQGLTALVNGLNQVKPAVERVVGAIALLLAVSRAAAGLRGVEMGALGLGGLLPGAAPLAARGQVAAQLARAAGTAGTAGTAAALTGTEAGIVGVGAAATSVLGPLALLAAAIGALILVGRTSDAHDKLDSAGKDLASSYAEGKKAADNSDISKMRSEAARQQKDADSIAKTGSAFGSIQDMLTAPTLHEAFAGWDWKRVLTAPTLHEAFADQGNGPWTQWRRDQATQGRASAADLRRRADLAASNAAYQAERGTPDGRAFFGPQYTGVDTGASLIKTQGVGAKGATNLLADLIKNTTADKGGLQRLLQPEEGTQGVADIIKGITDRIGKMTNPLEQQSALTELQGAERQLLAKAREAKDHAQIDAASQLLQEATAAADESLISNVKARIDSIKATEPNQGKSHTQIAAQLTAALTTVGNNGDINGMVALMGLADQKFLDTFRANIKAEQAAIRYQINAIRAALAASQEMTNALIADSGDDRRAAILSGTGSNRDKSLQANLKKYQGDMAKQDRILKSLDTAGPLAAPSGSAFDKGKAAGDADALEIARLQAQAIAGDPISQAATQLRVAQYQLAHADKNKAEYYQALKAVNDAEYALAQANLDASVAAVQATVIPGDPQSAAAANIKVAEQQVRAAVGAAARAAAQQRLNEANYAGAQADTAVAVAAAQAAGVSGDPISQATADLNAARITLSAAVGKADYYNALKSYRDKQYALAQAELDKANNLELLNIDITDPVAQANAKLDAARRKLAYDRSHGIDTTADKVAVRQAQSDAAGAAWNQEFSDQQTNYQLQRTSLTAYLSYLQAQHNYLSAVKNKTRQQVDELNQVDQALKSLTDSMDGQFNLGQIKVPSPYEVRRSMAGPAAGATTQTVTINVNGNDLSAMRGVLGEYLGQGVMQTTGSTTRKV